MIPNEYDVVHHLGYRIEAHSNRLADGKWDCEGVLVFPDDSERRFDAANLFNTEDEAIVGIMGLGKKFADQGR